MDPSWFNSFQVFYEYMGDRPPNTSLHRINNDGNYEPGNCKWATQGEQHANKSKPKTRTFTRTRKQITINGVAKTWLEWSEESGLEIQVIRYRMRKGWAEDDWLKPSICGRGRPRLIK